MKTFEIKAKGTLTQYIKDNAIKAKGEVNRILFDDAESNPTDSCFRINSFEPSKGLSVSL